MAIAGFHNLAFFAPVFNPLGTFQGHLVCVQQGGHPIHYRMPHQLPAILCGKLASPSFGTIITQSAGKQFQIRFRTIRDFAADVPDDPGEGVSSY